MSAVLALLPVLAALVPASIAAQRIVTIPPPGSVLGTTTAERAWACTSLHIYQQVINRRLVTGQEATLKSIKFDVAVWSANPAPNWDVFVGYAATTPNTVSTVFQNNRADQLFRVFSGVVPVNKTTGQAEVRFNEPFDYDPGKGDLLVEIVENTLPVFTGTTVKAAYQRPMAMVSWRGEGGLLPGRFGSRLRFFGAGIFVTPRGRELELESVDSAQSLFVLGPGQAPQSLTAIGAPGNNLYVTPLVVLPMNARLNACSSFPGFAGLRLPVPGNPSLERVQFSAQVVSLDTAANAAGLVFSQAADMRIGPLHRDTGMLVVGGTAQTRGQFITPGSYHSLPLQLEVVD